MNILVIGNGFDIAHGLPTKYGNFLEFVQAFNRVKSSTEDSRSPYYKYFNTLNVSKQYLYNELDKLVTGNRWLKFFEKIYDDRSKDGKDGWIDFEREISIIVQALDSARHTLSNQFKSGKNTASMEQIQLNILSPVLYPDQGVMDYRMREYKQNAIKIYQDNLISDLNKLTRCLEIYLSDYISVDNCPILKDIAGLNIDHVLSFNYTDTFKLIYDNTNGRIEYDFIHGKADIDKDINSCNLVLGIDEYLYGDERNKDNEFIQFKKFYQRIYKGTGCRFVDWLDSLQSNNNQLGKTTESLNIYIYGHSLDVTDADILKKLILAKNAYTTIFHYSKEALGSQIANLVKVIGEDELIKRTDGRNRSIIFKQSSSETV